MEILATYPDDLRELEENPEWQHGFNSGMLAASRMYMDLSVAYEDDVQEDLDGDNIPPLSERLATLRQSALDDFPNLDSKALARRRAPKCCAPNTSCSIVAWEDVWWVHGE